MSEATLIALQESLIKIAAGELNSLHVNNLKNIPDHGEDETLASVVMAVSEGRSLNSVEIDVQEDGGASVTLGYIKAE